MPREQDTASTEMLRKRISSFNRDSLPPEEVVLRTSKELEHRLIEEHRKRHTEHRAVAEQLQKIYAPLSDLISKDPRAAEGIQGLREIASHKTRQALTAPSFPRVQPMITSGSITTWAVPPYDFPWGFDDPGGGLAEHQLGAGTWYTLAETSGGGGFEGYPTTGAGWGLNFHPIGTGMLVFGADILYNVLWSEQSNAGAVAHTSGYTGFFIEQYDLNWNPQPGVGWPILAEDYIWSDGTGWWEQHEGQYFGFKSLSFPIPVSSDNNYSLLFFSVQEADGSGNSETGFYGDAICELRAIMPMVSLTQVLF